MYTRFLADTNYADFLVHCLQSQIIITSQPNRVCFTITVHLVALPPPLTLSHPHPSSPLPHSPLPSPLIRLTLSVFSFFT